MDIGADLYTYHTNTQAGLNNATPGVYVVMSGLAIGAYYNSDRRPSMFGGYVFETPDRKFALLTGCVSGYRPAGKPELLPMLIPSLRLSLAAQFAMRVAFLPHPPAGSSAGLHLSLEFTTNK